MRIICEQQNNRVRGVHPSPIPYHVDTLRVLSQHHCVASCLKVTGDGPGCDGVESDGEGWERGANEGEVEGEEYKVLTS